MYNTIRSFITVVVITTVSIQSSNAQNSHPRVGGDADVYGCLASAGYTYSKLKATCIRLFETPIKLNQIDTNSTASFFAAVVFNQENTKAEVFLPSNESQILNRIGKKGHYSWENHSLKLSRVKFGFQLLKDGKIIFRSESKK